MLIPIFYHPEIIRALRGAVSDLVITYDRLWKVLWQERFADPLRDAETFKINASGAILDIGKKAASLDQIHGQYMGLLKFSPAGWAVIERLLCGISQDKIDRLAQILDKCGHNNQQNQQADQNAVCKRVHLRIHLGCLRSGDFCIAIYFDDRFDQRVTKEQKGFGRVHVTQVVAPKPFCSFVTR